MKEARGLHLIVEVTRLLQIEKKDLSRDIYYVHHYRTFDWN